VIDSHEPPDRASHAQPDCDRTLTSPLPPPASKESAVRLSSNVQDDCDGGVGDGWGAGVGDGEGDGCGGLAGAVATGGAGGGGGAESCVRSSPLSFTTRRAVRCVRCEFEEAVTRIVAFPIPVVGFTVTHAASLRAVHSQSRVELTVTLAVPPACGIVRVAVDAETTQRTDEGATNSVWLVTPPHPAVTSRIAAAIP
jgi:hypothetical protein